MFILSLASSVDLSVFTSLSKHVESSKSEAITLGICKDDWHFPLHLSRGGTERPRPPRTSREAVWVFLSLLLHWKWIEFSLQRRVLVALDFNQVTCSQSLKAYKTEMSRWARGGCATRFVKPVNFQISEMPHGVVDDTKSVWWLQHYISFPSP